MHNFGLVLVTIISLTISVEMGISRSLACWQLICEFDSRYASKSAACLSNGHRWPINISLKASLKKPGLASGEGYVELRDGESLSLVLGTILNIEL